MLKFFKRKLPKESPEDVILPDTKVSKVEALLQGLPNVEISQSLVVGGHTLQELNIKISGASLRQCLQTLNILDANYNLLSPGKPLDKEEPNDDDRPGGIG